MPSIIPDFKEDIFISYRQKDNKGDRWVSEFVSALKNELDSTFKEEISVYFDNNPTDGLRETHNVDASLKDKLKCSIFIPILSRTYCDPNSFAWNNEFKAFVDLANNDQFGLMVMLPNNNYSNRVLPIRIHDLDYGDIKMCEAMLGGPIRGIDFIYKSTGVNRPLRSQEEKPNENINRTIYRDQINKVALAIKDIIESMKAPVLIGQIEQDTQSFSFESENSLSINKLDDYPASGPVETQRLDHKMKVKETKSSFMKLNQYYYLILIILGLFLLLIIYFTIP